MSNKKKLKLNFIFLFCYLMNSVVFADCIKTIIIMRHGEKNLNASFGQLDCQGLNRALALRQVLDSRFGQPAAIYAANPNVTTAESSRCYPYNRPLATIEPTAIYFNMPVITTYGKGYIGGPQSPSDITVPCSDIPVPTTNFLPLPQPPTPQEICGAGSSAGDIELAREILSTPSYCGKTIFIAWDHKHIPTVVYGFYNLLGLNPINKIPVWPYGPCLPSYAEAGYCTIDFCNPNYNFDTIYRLEVNQSHTQPTITLNLSSEGLDGQPTDCPT